MQSVNKKDAIYQKLKRDITSGKYIPESRLPKEIDFAKQLGVGRVTLRSALEHLLDDGLVLRIPSKGTFVASANKINMRRYLAIMPPAEYLDSPMIHILPGIEKSASEELAYLQSYHNHIFRALEINEGVERIRESAYDGIFYMANSVNGSERDFQIIKATGLPVIMPLASPSDHDFTGFATMRVDEKKAFSAALRVLTAKGHKRIGSIFLRKSSKRPCRGFFSDEYIDFLKSIGVDSSPRLIHYCKENCYELIAASVEKLLKLPERPTAIICSSDFVAFYVYQKLREIKIKIPEEIAIIGYCNYKSNELLSPGLSSVDLFFEKIGTDAFELMLKSDEWWQPGLTPPEIITPFEIIERGSTNIKYN